MSPAPRKPIPASPFSGGSRSGRSSDGPNRSGPRDGNSRFGRSVGPSRPSHRDDQRDSNRHSESRPSRDFAARSGSSRPPFRSGGSRFESHWSDNQRFDGPRPDRSSRPTGVEPHQLPGIFLSTGRRQELCVKSLVPGFIEFDETIIKQGSEEYRVWDPTRSKLAAALVKGVQNPGLRPGDVVLYLGASHGYTPSFVSDILGPQGLMFALDIAPRVVRDLVFVCQRRPNIAPILADAGHPESFADRVCQVDWIFQDVAAKDQVGIFLKNVKWFLKDGGLACLALKARSIDVSKNPREVYAKVRLALDKEVDILEFVELDPLEKDHGFFVVKKR